MEGQEIVEKAKACGQILGGEVERKNAMGQSEVEHVVPGGECRVAGRQFPFLEIDDLHGGGSEDTRDR